MVSEGFGRSHNKQPDSFVRQSFLISSELHTAGKNSFYSDLMKISEYFNFGNFSPDLVDTAKSDNVSTVNETEIYFLLATYSTAFSKTRTL